MDEAETGLKSSLAVKIFGSDLADARRRRPTQVKRIISKVPGIADITVVRELGQPSLIDRARPRQDRPLRPERDDVNTLIETAMGGKAAIAGDSGRAPVRSGGAHAGAVPQGRGRHQEPADRHARRPAPAAQPVRRHQGQQRRVVHLSRIAIRASSASSSASRAATWRARCEEAQREGRAAGASCPSATPSTGAANTRTIWRRRSQMKIIAAADRRC